MFLCFPSCSYSLALLLFEACAMRILTPITLFPSFVALYVSAQAIEPGSPNPTNLVPGGMAPSTTFSSAPLTSPVAAIDSSQDAPAPESNRDTSDYSTSSPKEDVEDAAMDEGTEVADGG